MSRLVQELPQIPSRMWSLNTGDCLGGKSSAKVMKRCVLGLSAVRKLKQRLLLRLVLLEGVSRFCLKGSFTESIFSVDFKQAF